MTAPFLVTGSTGRTGKAVVKALVAAGQPVRAFHRKPEQAELLTGIGATETALGDFNDADSLKRAAEGCAGIVHIGPPMDPNEVDQTKAALAAAKSAGVERFIYYSVMHPLRREVRHHRLKLDAEEQVVESGAPYTIVQPIRYMQHLETIWRQVREEGVHAMGFSTERRFNIVDLADLAEATAIVATRPGHLYATYELAGPEALSMRDVAERLTVLLGRTVEAKAIPLETLEARARAAGMAEDRIANMLAMNDHYDRYGFLGNPNVLTWILGRAPTRFDAYVQRLMAAG